MPDILGLSCESVVKSHVVWLGCNLIDSFSQLGSDVIAEFASVGMQLNLIHDLFWQEFG